MDRKHPARRISQAVLAGLALVALALGAAAGSAAKPGTNGKKASVAPTKPAVKADRDGDKIFDDLEQRLAPLAASAERSVIVTLRAAATGERTAALEGDVGDFDVTQRFRIINGFAGTLTKEQIVELAANPAVARIEENSRVRALNAGAQLSFGVTKARVDAPTLDGEADGNVATYSGGDLVAAVIDTGIDGTHLDLDEGKVLAFKDFVNGRTTAYDDHGHGTHVAATIAGDGDARTDGANRGVAPAAGLVGVKALDANGGGSMATVTAAIDWVVQVKDAYGIEAINLSLGAAGCSDGTDATSQAVNRAAAAGLVVVAAAGNEGPGACTIGAPGAATGALTVGAMADTATGGFKQASFSSRGPTADGRVKPDVSAPGVGIESAATGTTNGYVSQSGTSMATPFVAGVALLMKDANPALTQGEVKNRVMSTAIDWGRGGDNRTAGTRGADADYGAGRLDGYAAIKAAGAPLGTGPAAPAHALHEGSLGGSGAYVDLRLDVVSTGFPIAATMIISSLSAGVATNPDFDLYLYNPSGSLVARSERIERQEDVSFTPTATGTYTLRVASYYGSGPFFVDVSGGLGTTVTAAPTAAGIYTGTLRSGGASSLRADDNVFFQVNSTTSGTRVADWWAQTSGVPNAATSGRITYRGKSSETCTQTLYAYNYRTSAWTQLDSRSVGTGEVTVAVTPAGAFADYVSGTTGDGTVTVRVRCTRSDGTSFHVSGDLMSLTYTK
jgi:serine protease AprX